ncbi:unnamed protein product [Rotaria magnacalcarata]|nr:unnamed protein product [Rotaria magnacalcarata]CAF1553534.1 unnamed protein product [Rotaria magnacalcarata]CAF1596121.1 unnamed protein product [Rotaria magnacalcarata]CAF2054974.1 unnamed protein product [Rotaria magnacalcarata]CAF2154781.1 unnamed protein product [Rotaria magnacalcarata]
MDASGKADYWHQQDVNPPTKSHLKLPVNTQVTSHYDGAVHFYDGISGNNNQLKRTYSGSDQSASPFKKRPFIQQVIPPPPPIQPQSSSVDHSDEDDDDDDDEGDTINMSSGVMEKNSGTKRDDSRRRAAHTAAEQKRRNAIRKGYDALQSLVPNSHLLDPISSQKVSKAAILKRSTDYLIQLNKEQQQLNSQLDAKKKEIYCLRAVQKTYEDILEMNMNSIKNASKTIDDEDKFKVFQNIADAIFVSFDQAMQSGQVTSFAQFTSTILRWIEDSCRPSDINDIMRRVLGN